MILRLQLFIFLFFLSLGAYAKKNKPIYGPEFTFFVGITEGYHPSKEVSKIAKMLRDDCKTCEMHTDVGLSKYRFTVELNGKTIEFIISGDPQVVEVQVEPMTLEQWKQISTSFEKEVFNRIKRQFKPHEWNGAGHLNIGLQSFETVNHLKNFITYNFNHPELAFVLGQSDYDFSFARHILQAAPETRMEMAQALKNFTPDPQQSDWENKIDLLKAIEFVYTERDRTDNLEAIPAEFRGLTLLKKFNALAFEELGLPHRARAEVRTVRPQKSIHQWISQLELFERVIELTRTHAETFDPERTYAKTTKVHLENFKSLLVQLDLNPENSSVLMKKSWLKSWSSIISTADKTQCLSLFH